MAIYRFLEVGEVLRLGDQYLTYTETKEKKWLEITSEMLEQFTTGFNTKVPSGALPVRRQLDLVLLKDIPENSSLIKDYGHIWGLMWHVNNSLVHLVSEGLDETVSIPVERVRLLHSPATVSSRFKN